MLGVAAAAWVVGDSHGTILAWTLLVATGVVTVALAVPLLAPELDTVVLDDHGLEGRLYGRAVAVDWAAVELIRIVTVVGEPVLEVHERDRDAPPSASGRVVTTSRGLLLPIGADLVALDQFLARRLGRARIDGPAARR